MNNFSKILVSVAAGAAVGAILGILFAPEKGSELRRKMTERRKKIADEVKEKFEFKVNDRKERVEDLA